MWPFGKGKQIEQAEPTKQAEQKAKPMEFTDFLARHPKHNVGAITDRVIVHCFDCNEALYLSHEQWTKVLEKAGNKIPGLPQPPAENIPPTEKSL